MRPSQVAAVLPKLLQSKRTPFIWGDPGIGKSDILRAVAKDLKIGLIDMRLSIYDPTDLKGFPVVKGTGKSEAMHFVPPALLPTKGKGILFLDELPAAPPAVQAAAYQLILDKRLGEYVLPDGWAIVAAGNHARNGGVHYSLAPALANRFVHIEMETSAEDWDVWANNNGITDLTRAFMRFRPALIHDMNARKTGMAFPTPRSWAFADDIAKQHFDATSEFELLKGTVGEGAAVEYLAFLKTARELPTANEILVSPDTAPVPKSPGAKHAAVVMLERHADKTNIKQCMHYLKRLDVEYQTAFIYGVTRAKRELCETRDYIDWCVANKAMIGGV